MCECTSKQNFKNKNKIVKYKDYAEILIPNGDNGFHNRRLLVDIKNLNKLQHLKWVC